MSLSAMCGYRTSDIVLDDVRDVTLKDIDAPTEEGVEQVVRK